ncbi:unnamed protein product [Penicillium viridicatum]
MKTKAVGPNPITAPKLDNEHASLLGRQQFDWWEDVENDIVMKSQGIPPASPVPITTPKLDDAHSANDITVETEDLGVISTDATNDIAMETEDLDVQKELLPTANGPNSEISMGTEDLASNSELHVTSNGPVTATGLVSIPTTSSPTSLRP